MQSACIKYIGIKKSTLFVIAVITLALLLVVAVAVIKATTPTVVPNGMTIVIDAGHGGYDGGVVGNSGEKESEINLAVSRSLRHFLREAGYKVVMTRDSDVDLSSGEGSKKKSDMLARKKIIEEATPDLVVSVHQNSFPLRSVCGAQVFYAPSGTSQEVASVIQNTLNDTLGFDKTAKSGDYYILQCTEYPSVLVECGFLSNPDEEAKLLTPEYRQKVAYAIYTGVRAVLE